LGICINTDDRLPFIQQTDILVTIFVSAVITQVIIWMISPTALVEVNKADYLVRIGILSIAAFLALLCQ
jgi:hypothetical protein